MFTNSRTRIALVAVLATILALLALAPSTWAQSPTGETEVIGVVEAIESNSIFTVNGLRTNAAGAEFYRTIWVGAVVKVEGVLQPDGTILAREVKSPEDDDLRQGYSEFTGVLTSLSSTSAVVNGIVFVIDSARVEIEPGLALGMVVKVQALLSDGGVWVAREIERDDSSDSCEFEIEVRSANLRSGPGTEYPVIGYTFEDDEFHVLATDASQTWVQVATSTGAAWVALSVGELEDDCDGLAISDDLFRDDDDGDDDSSRDSGDDSDDDSGRSGHDDSDDDHDDGDDSGRGDDSDDHHDDGDDSGDDRGDDDGSGRGDDSSDDHGDDD